MQSMKLKQHLGRKLRGEMNGKAVKGACECPEPEESSRAGFSVFPLAFAVFIISLLANGNFTAFKEKVSVSYSTC